jgi:hypothetical protein
MSLLAKDTNIIVGVASHDKNIHDSKTLTVAISHANRNRNKPIKQAVRDRGYVGAKVAVIKTLISSPTCPLSRFLESLKSDLRCPIIGSMAARLLHSLRFLSRLFMTQKL